MEISSLTLQIVWTLLLHGIHFFSNALIDTWSRKYLIFPISWSNLILCTWRWVDHLTDYGGSWILRKTGRESWYGCLCISFWVVRFCGTYGHAKWILPDHGSLHLEGQGIQKSNWLYQLRKKNYSWDFNYKMDKGTFFSKQHP